MGGGGMSMSGNMGGNTITSYGAGINHAVPQISNPGVAMGGGVGGIGMGSMPVPANALNAVVSMGQPHHHQMASIPMSGIGMGGMGVAAVGGGQMGYGDMSGQGVWNGWQSGP